MEELFRMIGAVISKHISGGVLWSYVIGGGVILFMWAYIQFLENDIRHLEEDLETVTAQSESKTATVESQSRQAQRKAKSQEEQNNVENEIAVSPSPIDYTLGWLRDRRTAEQAGNSDTKPD